MNDYRNKIHTYFSNAETIKNVTSKVILKIKDEQKIPKEKILLATSICSDEVNHGTHSFAHQFNCGEFILGGITGYPFAGETGLGAYLSHIPDDGAALIIFGPHVGISKDGNIGLNKRNMQSKETPTCGALTGILERFGKNMELPENKPGNFDYQMDFITEKLSEKKQYLLNSKNPIIEIARQSYSLIENDIRRMLAAKKESFNNYPVYILGGILVNTDVGYDDYFEEILLERI